MKCDSHMTNRPPEARLQAAIFWQFHERVSHRAVDSIQALGEGGREGGRGTVEEGSNDAINNLQFLSCR